MLKGKLYVLCGLGFGDEGKGTITDSLVRTHGFRHVVRYNGGPQAGHNVVVPEGRWHCFAQFGSGTFVARTQTHLSREMLIEPENLMREASALAAIGAPDALERLTIDADAAIITPMHKMLGQMLEISRGTNRFGSCGMGVGQAVLDRDQSAGLTVRDVLAGDVLRAKLQILREEKFVSAFALAREHPSVQMYERLAYFMGRSDPDDLVRGYRAFFRRDGIGLDQEGCFLPLLLAQGISVLFEGAQGALLDRRFGFSPYVTKTRATFHNAEGLLGAQLNDAALRDRYDVAKIGIARAYSHRHGAGPLVTELSELGSRFRDPRNLENPWQGKFRVGWLDLLALRYGIAINDGVDALAVTCLDQLSGLESVRVCFSYLYEGDTSGLDRFFEWEPLGAHRARIAAFRYPNDSAGQHDTFAQMLFRCRPLEFIDLPGWSQDLRAVRDREGLPLETRNFLEFLESGEGLGVPVMVASVGPRSDQKLFFEA